MENAINQANNITNNKFNPCINRSRPFMDGNCKIMPTEYKQMKANAKNTIVLESFLERVPGKVGGDILTNLGSSKDHGILTPWDPNCREKSPPTLFQLFQHDSTSNRH